MVQISGAQRNLPQSARSVLEGWSGSYVIVLPLGSARRMLGHSFNSQ